MEREEILPEDKSNKENFTTSLLCPSIEKDFRNRIRDREEDAIAAMKRGHVQQAIVFVSQIEELQDIILDWKNIRKDIERKNIEQSNAKA